MTSDAVTAIVVTYNTREFTVPLLGDLARELRGVPGSEILVIDNGSVDGTLDAILAACPEVRCESSPTNLGFAGAVNRVARDVGTRWLLLVNPDARIEEGAVTRLVQVATDHPGHGLYGGQLRDPVRRTNEDSVGVLPTLPNLLLYATGVGTVARRLGWRSGPRRTGGSPVPVEVDALPGTFLLAETAAWREVGGFNETFFMYSEDLDLCVRMGVAGYRPLYVPQAVVSHVGGASSTSGGKEVLKLRGLVTYMRIHWSRRRAGLGRQLLLFGVGLRRLAGAPKRSPTGRWEIAWAQRETWLGGW